MAPIPISSASGSNLTLQAYATGYAIPAAIVINAPIGVKTQLSPIVLQQVAIDPNAARIREPAWQPRLSRWPSVRGRGPESGQPDPAGGSTASRTTGTGV